MPTVTLSQLQTDVLDRLEGNSLLFTLAEITNSLNEFIRIVNVFTGMTQATLTVPGGTVANQLQYLTPAGMIYPLKVSVDGSYLYPFSMESLARMYRGWATDTTAKLGSIQRWSAIGMTKFVLHPIDSIGGRTISVLGVLEPTPLASSGDTVQLEDSYILAAIEYASHRVRLKEGGKPFADATMALESFYRIIGERNNLQMDKMPTQWTLSGVVKP